LLSTVASREGAIVSQDGVKVKKEESRFVVKENLIMRKLPNRQSDSNYYTTGDLLYQYGQRPSGVVLGGKSYKSSQKEKVRILPKGYVITIIARTAATERIEGIDASWFFYNFEIAGDFVLHGWVFGGYLGKYDDANDQEYQDILLKSLLKLGWIEPDE
jgi:hypothetical protein